MKKIDVVLLILHLVTTILSVVNAVNANDNVSLICWIIAAICWGSCTVLDIIKLST